MSALPAGFEVDTLWAVSNLSVLSFPLKRFAPWIVALVLLVAMGTWLRSKASRPELPKLIVYPQLPGKFNELLATAHHAVRTSNEDLAAVRRLARFYQANRLVSEANDCYEWLAHRAGGLTAKENYFQACLALDAGDLAKAQTALRATLTMDPDYLPARISLADSLFKSDQAAAAAGEYEAVLTRDNTEPHALIGLARFALQREDDAAAITRLEQALAAHPDVTSAAGLLAQIMNRRGEKDRAEALTEWSRRNRDPVLSDPWIEELFADCYDAQRLTLRFEELVYSSQWEKAEPLLARVEELDPKNWLIHLFRGWTLVRNHRDDEAIAEYRRALEKSGDPERVVPLLVQCLIGQKRMDEAATVVEQSLRARPDSVGLLTLQADLAVRQHDETRSRALLAALLEKEPYLYTANMHLTQILWARGEREKAVQCLLRVVKAFPVDVASRGLLAQYYIEKEDFRAAIPLLEQALPQAEAASPACERLSAMLVTACLREGSVQAATGRAEEAAQLYEKAGRISSAGVDALGQLAGELAQARQFRPAAGVLTHLATLQPANPTVQLSLGDVLYQAGDAAAAKSHWEKALAGISPDDVALRDALGARLGNHITPELFN